MWLISLFSEAKPSLHFANINRYFLHLIPIIASDWICLDIPVYRKPNQTKPVFVFLSNYLLTSKLFNESSVSCHSTLVAASRTLLPAHPARAEIKTKGPSSCCPSLPLPISACLHQGATLTASRSTPYPWSPIFTLSLRKVQEQRVPPTDILLDSIHFLFFP